MFLFLFLEGESVGLTMGKGGGGCRGTGAQEDHPAGGLKGQDLDAWLWCHIPHHINWFGHNQSSPAP